MISARKKERGKTVLNTHQASVISKLTVTLFLAVKKQDKKKSKGMVGEK